MKVSPRLIIFLLPYFGLGQNLVDNPSFEDYLECPNALGTFATQVASWSTPTEGSTDYFNRCSAVMSAPENFNGIQNPMSGDAYAGFYFYAPGDYREYIQVALKESLRKGLRYELAFYVSLAEGSDFAVKDFGVALSQKKLVVKTKKELSRGTLFRIKENRFQVLEINHSNFHEDKSVWLKISTSFTAKGFENYLILGNLRNNKTTRKVQTKRKETKKGAYYYIDMVSLSLEEGQNIPDTIETDTRYIFEHIHFDFDQFRISEEAQNELSTLYRQLENNKDLKIEIHGHTDSSGSNKYNQSLSEKRAKVIAHYFLQRGIASERISWFGHGAKKPIAGNTSEKDRARNRRVEFQVYF